MNEKEFDYRKTLEELKSKMPEFQILNGKTEDDTHIQCAFNILSGNYKGWTLAVHDTRIEEDQLIIDHTTVNEKSEVVSDEGASDLIGTIVYYFLVDEAYRNLD